MAALEDKRRDESPHTANHSRDLCFWRQEMKNVGATIVRPHAQAGRRQLKILLPNMDQILLLEVVRHVAMELLPTCSQRDPPSPPVKLAHVCHYEGQELDLMKEGRTQNEGYPPGSNRGLRRLHWWGCGSASDICLYVDRNIRIAPSPAAAHSVHLQLVARGVKFEIRQTGGLIRRLPKTNDMSWRKGLLAPPPCNILMIQSADGVDWNGKQTEQQGTPAVWSGGIWGLLMSLWLGFQLPARDEMNESICLLIPLQQDAIANVGAV